MVRSFFSKEQGQGLVEYALILVLIAITVIGILTVVQGKSGTHNCMEGFIWSEREQACLQGYRPGLGR